MAGCVRYCRPLTSTLMWAQRIAREDLGCKAAAPPPLSTTCGAERRERSMRLARGYGSVSVSHSRSRCQHWCASIERAHRERQREEPKQCGRCSMSAADATGCGASPVSSAFAPLSSPPPLDERACVRRGDCVCARRGDHTSRSAPRRHVAALLAPRHPPHPSPQTPPPWLNEATAQGWLVSGWMDGWVGQQRRAGLDREPLLLPLG